MKRYELIHFHAEERSKYLLWNASKFVRDRNGMFNGAESFSKRIDQWET